MTNFEKFEQFLDETPNIDYETSIAFFLWEISKTLKQLVSVTKENNL